MTGTTPQSPSADHSALAFYQDLHRAFDATVQRRAGQASLIDGLLSQAFDSFDGNVAIQCEDEPALACKRGCATCCTLRVGATAPEVLLVARFLRAVTPGLIARGIDLVGNVRAADAHTRGLSEQDRVTLRQPCPFIAQGVCVIYSVRPLACRGHASHDVRACVDAAAGRREDVPYSEGHRMVRTLVQHAMQSSMRKAGLAWGMYELNSSLLMALDDEQSQDAWLAGADVLAPTALNEVSADEMSAVFDELMPG